MTDDACVAMLKVAGKKSSGIPSDQRRQALQAVVEKSKDETTKKKAEDLLKTL